MAIFDFKCFECEGYVLNKFKLKAENSSEFRTNLEHAFEDFYHQADLLEATIRLAQQQCLNTFASVASISSNHIHFLTPPRNGPPSKF